MSDLTRKETVLMDGQLSGAKATVQQRGSVGAQTVELVDTNGDPITSFGGGTQYTSGGTPPASPVGGTLVFDNEGTWEHVSDTNPLPVNATVEASIDPTGLATDTNQTTIIGHLDGVETLLTTIDTVLDTIKVDTEAIETAVEALQTGQLTDGHNVTVDNASIAVTGTFWQATQPISGTVTANAGTGSFDVNLQAGDGTDITQTDGALDVNIASGSSSGTEYTEGDTDATITGTAVLMEAASDTLVPFQGSTTDGLLVNLGSNNDVTEANSSDILNTLQGSLTVDATNFDIRALTNSDVVTAELSATDNAVLDQIETNQDSQTALLTTIDADTSVLAGNGTTGPLKAEDTAHATGDIGIPAWGVRNDTLSTTFAANGDYSPIATNSRGAVYVTSNAGADLPVSLASVPSHAVTNAGTFAVQNTAATPAGNNNIGDVDIASIAAGDNNIGNVDIVTLPATPAGTNLIGRISASNETSTVYNGTTAITPKFASIDVATSGDNTLVAAVTSKKIRVLSLTLVAAGTVNVRFESGAGGTALSGQMNLVANTGFVLPYNPVGWFETASGTLLNLELSAAVSVDGMLTYIEV